MNATTTKPRTKLSVLTATRKAALTTAPRAVCWRSDRPRRVKRPAQTRAGCSAKGAEYDAFAGGFGPVSGLLGGLLLAGRVVARVLDRAPARRPGLDHDGELAGRQAGQRDRGGQPLALDDVDLLAVDEDVRLDDLLVVDLLDADL